MSSIFMTYYGYFSDHIFSFKLALFALLSNCYAIFGLEDLLHDCVSQRTVFGKVDVFERPQPEFIVISAGIEGVIFTSVGIARLSF